ncbi:MAG TPA: class I SAM-dependent methyltransferase, partial [Candidatus Lokiarchaeia archaeon]|nr:class I SAM-dependent methyltransferase [Candidatus Lokiarchaeia archaeon]
ESMLDLAREAAMENEVTNIEFLRLNALDMDYTSEFDGIFSNFVVHFLPNHKPFYQKIFDALKSGGQMVVTAAQKPPSGTIVEIDGEAMIKVI